MENITFLKNLAQQLAETIPNNLNAIKTDCEKNLLGILQTAFSKLQILTREEFDVQCKVLARTRQKIESLEKQVAQLEATLQERKDA